MATKITKATGAAIGSAVLAAIPAVSPAVTIDEEDTNDLFPGQVATVGDIIDAAVDNVSDPADFFHYTGLTPGSLFDIFVDLDPPLAGNSNESLDVAALDSLQAALAGPVTVPGNQSTTLSGTVPGNGEVIVSVRANHPAGGGGAEEYQISLTTRSAVPLPASVALVAAGLVGLGGLHVARRRRAG